MAGGPLQQNARSPPASGASLSNDYQCATDVNGGLFVLPLSDSGWSIADGQGAVLSEPDEVEQAGWHLLVRFESERQAADAIRTGPDDVFDIAPECAWVRHSLSAGATPRPAYDYP